MPNPRFIPVHRNQIDREEWNQIVAEASEGTFFHTYEWSHVLCEYGKKTGMFRPQHILIRDQETDRLVGILPLLETRKNRLVSLPYGDYGGPCIDPTADRQQVFEAMLTEVERVSRKGAQMTFLKSLPRGYFRWLGKHGYAAMAENYTFVLSTRHATSETLWQNFKRSPRQGIRRAQRKGVVVERAVDTSHLSEYYQLHVETMKRLGAEPRPYTFFETTWNLLAPKEAIHLLLARYQDQYISGIIAFPYKETLHLYANASLKKYQRLSANYLLCFTAIEWALNHKFNVDFGLSPLKESSGLYQFKERWGGAPKLLFSAYKSFSIRNNLRLSIWLLRKTLSRTMPESLKNVARTLSQATGE